GLKVFVDRVSTGLAGIIGTEVARLVQQRYPPFVLWDVKCFGRAASQKQDAELRRILRLRFDVAVFADLELNCVGSFVETLDVVEHESIGSEQALRSVRQIL